MKEGRHNRLQGPRCGRVILAQIPSAVDLTHGCAALANSQSQDAGACCQGLDP